MQIITKKSLFFTCIVPFIVVLGINTSTQAAEYVVPSGKTIGIKIYTDGLVVTNTSDFVDNNGNSVCPASDSGIDVGDVIKSVNGNEITSCEQFENLLDGSNLNIEIIDEGQTSNVSVTPLLSDDGKYHIGAWVRDSTAGIGTLTCFNPTTLQYYALGHAVTDVDTGNIMTVESGNIQDCTISSVNKGYVGFPGSISADFSMTVIGSIENNTEVGISGELENSIAENQAIPVANLSEVHNGDASILSDVCGNGIEEYSATIKIISNTDTKNMVIDITDTRLFNQTGGIVQGMSGAPVIQDGKLIGAVTHVFINDPHKGYCISAEKFIN